MISNTSILQQRLHPTGQSRCFHVFNSFYSSILSFTESYSPDIRLQARLYQIEPLYAIEKQKRLQQNE